MKSLICVSEIHVYLHCYEKNVGAHFINAQKIGANICKSAVNTEYRIHNCINSIDLSPLHSSVLHLIYLTTFRIVSPLSVVEFYMTMYQYLRVPHLTYVCLLVVLEICSSFPSWFFTHLILIQFFMIFLYIIAHTQKIGCRMLQVATILAQYVKR